MLFDPYAYDLATSAPAAPLPGGALAAEALLEVPAEARAMLWQGLMEAVAARSICGSSCPQASSAPPPFSVQHAGKPRFDPADLRAQTLAGWHRLAGIELRLAAQALEALALMDAAGYRERLAEQCARDGPVIRRTEAPRRGMGGAGAAALGTALASLSRLARAGLADLRLSGAGSGLLVHRLASGGFVGEDVGVVGGHCQRLAITLQAFGVAPQPGQRVAFGVQHGCHAQAQHHRPIY